MNKPEILIISNRLDFTTDYVCFELEKREASYLRINRDEFQKYCISFDAIEKELEVNLCGRNYFINESILKAVWYRAPIYLRDIYQPGISAHDQLYRTQWSAFVRNLSVFDSSLWINSPEATFKAENKMYQLQLAHKIGMNCPHTVVTNAAPSDIEPSRYYIVKPLDTAVLRIEDKEAFVYANIVQGNELLESCFDMAPTVIQEFITPKVDVRVTVINTDIFAVEICLEKSTIDGDWRKQKNDVQYLPFILPDSLSSKCIQMLKELNLKFGAFDFALRAGIYYFLEVNPTGEWAWLVESAGQNIHRSICNLLQGKRDAIS